MTAKGRSRGSLTDLDRDIIAVLADNCRIPLTKVGDHLGVAPVKIAARIQSLSDKGLIRFTAQRNLRSYGIESFAIADIVLDGTDNVKAMAAICALRESFIVVEGLGRPHLLALMATATQKDMAELVLTRLAGIGGIASVELRSVLRVSRFPSGIGALQDAGTLWTPAVPDSDEPIIEKLEEDARATNSDIARQLGVSEASIRQRVAKLVSDQKLRFGILVDQRSLTVNNVRIDIAAHPSKIVEIAERFNEIAVFVAIVDGGNQIFAALQDPDPRRISDYIANDVERWDGVLGIRAQGFTRTLKHYYNCMVLPD